MPAKTEDAARARKAGRAGVWRGRAGAIAVVVSGSPDGSLM